MGRVLARELGWCSFESSEQGEHRQLGEFLLAGVLCLRRLISLLRVLGPSGQFGTTCFLSMSGPLGTTGLLDSSRTLRTPGVFGVAGGVLLQVIAMSFEVLEREALRRHRTGHLQRVDVDGWDEPPSE